MMRPYRNKLGPRWSKLWVCSLGHTPPTRAQSLFWGGYPHPFFDLTVRSNLIYHDEHTQSSNIDRNQRTSTYCRDQNIKYRHPTTKIALTTSIYMKVMPTQYRQHSYHIGIQHGKSCTDTYTHIAYTGCCFY
jgi:hypothetical protein